jgi:hypothetical protein
VGKMVVQPGLPLSGVSAGDDVFAVKSCHVISELLGQGANARLRGRLLPADDIQVVRVVHDTEHVSEGIDDGRRHESRLTPRGDRLVLLCAQRQQTLERRLDVVDVPVGDRTASPLASPGGA